MVPAEQASGLTTHCPRPGTRQFAGDYAYVRGEPADGGRKPIQAKVIVMQILVILFFLLFCGYGLMLIFAKDTAWGLVEWRNRNRGVSSQRTDQWNASATFQGVAIIVLGIGLLFFLPHGRSAGSVAGNPVINSQPTITVDGHPATPEEQRALQPIVGGHAGQDRNETPNTGQ